MAVLEAAGRFGSQASCKLGLSRTPRPWSCPLEQNLRALRASGRTRLWWEPKLSGVWKSFEKPHP